MITLHLRPTLPGVFRYLVGDFRCREPPSFIAELFGALGAGPGRRLDSGETGWVVQEKRSLVGRRTVSTVLTPQGFSPDKNYVRLSRSAPCPAGASVQPRGATL